MADNAVRTLYRMCNMDLLALKKEGLSETEIARKYDISVSKLRAVIAVIKDEIHKKEN